jgi:hypothetical protein
LKIRSAAVLSRTEFSRDVDCRNSITSEPSSRQSRMGNVRKLGELPKFLVFNSRTNSLGNRPVFAFYLLLFTFIQISVFSCRAIDMGLVTFCYLCLSDGAE